MIRFHNRVVDELPSAPTDGAALPQGAQAGDAALPVDAAPRLPAADRRPGRRRRRLHERPRARRARRRPDRRPDDAGGVLGRGVPARPQHGARLPTTGTAVSRRTAGSLDYMFDFSGARRQPRRRAQAARATGWPTGAGMYDFAAGGHPELAPPGGVATSTRPSGSTPCSPTRCATSRPGTFGGPVNIPFNDLRRNLAFRNLTRAKMLKLASGQDMAKFAPEGRPGHHPHQAADPRPGRGGVAGRR